MKPVVALVGRPNVGKSSLFNRMTRSRAAIVDDRPGVTRDRHFADIVWEDKAFILVDTGGFISDDTDDFAAHIREQLFLAVEEADHIVLLLDAKSGLSFYDHDLVRLLREKGKDFLSVVNKVDGESFEPALNDFYGLGIEKLYPLSAEHGYGFYDFMDALTKEMPSSAEKEEDLADGPVRLAIIGRPNVGKSSLVNKLLGEDRMVVSELAGTTRDSVDSLLSFNDKSYLLVDTAGIRRKSKVYERIEKFSVIKSLRAMERSHIALVLFDALEGIKDQDVKIAAYAVERGCACIFICNKWDLLDKEDKKIKLFEESLAMEAKFLAFAPLLSISALTGLRVNRILPLVDKLYAQYTSRVSTSHLNRIIEDATSRTQPSLHKGKRIKFYFASQVSTAPPRFSLVCNFPEAIHFSYERYLINQIREALDLNLVPLRLEFKERSGRIDYSSKKKKRVSGGPSGRKKRSFRKRF